MITPTPRQEHLATGIGLYVGAFFFFVVLDTTTKYLGQRYPIVQLVWIRFAVHAVLMLAIFAPRMGREMLRTANPRLQFVRGVLMVVQTYCMMTALTLLPLADATAIVFVAPLLVVALSARLLHEPVSAGTWLAVIAGFAGVLLIVRPGAGPSLVGALLALTMAVSNAFFQIITRRLSETDTAVATNFCTALIGTALAAVPAPFAWITPVGLDRALMLSIGLLGGGAHFVLIKAFEHAPASTLAPFMYTGMLWSIVLGWVVFGDLPDTLAVVGMATIVASGIYVVTSHRTARAPEVASVRGEGGPST